MRGNTKKLQQKIKTISFKSFREALERLSNTLSHDRNMVFCFGLLKKEGTGMNHRNNVNVNGYVHTPNYNDNVKDNGFDMSKSVELIAAKLVDKFGSPTSFAFYCKVAYKLPEAQIWKNYERATTGKNVNNAAGLFNWLCRRDMSNA